MAYQHASARRHLRRAARSSAVLGLSAVAAAAFSLSAAAKPIEPVQPAATAVFVQRGAVAQTAERTTYTVRLGDTLSGIAARAGLDSWRPIFDANRNIVSNPDLIYPGQRLVIPAKGEVVKPLYRATAQATAHPASHTWTRTRRSTPTRHRTSQAARVAQPRASAAGGSVWDRLAQCESGGNWSTNTGNGFYGGLQFAAGTWQAVGGSGMPHQASRETQIAMAQRVLARQGWGAWPSCSAKLGLR